MSRVRYDGPGGVLHAFGRTLTRGQTAVFDESETRSLQAQVPYIQITVDGKIQQPFVGAPSRPADVTRPSAHGSRRQWATYAEKQGIPVADAMSRDEIVAAIDAPPALAVAETQPDIAAPLLPPDENEIVAVDTSVIGESEALPGEGHTPSDKEKKS